MHIKKRGFTLAEVLITIAIIGMVAEMTIPALYANFKEMVYVQQAKVGYSTILNLFKDYEAGTDGAATDIIDPIVPAKDGLEKLIPYAKIVKKCEGTGGCFASRYAYLELRNDGYGHFETTYSSPPENSFQLANGMVIGIAPYTEGNSDCYTPFNDTVTDADGNYIDTNGDGIVPDHTTNYDNQCGQLWIDTNGPKLPNQFGRDAFVLILKPENGGYFYEYSGSLITVVQSGSLPK